MSAKELEIFFDYLKKSWQIFGPKESESATGKDNQVFIEPLTDFRDLIFDQRLPFYPFKRFFIPEKEKIFDYQNEKLKTAFDPIQKVALFGMNILDLKAVLLYDQVFEKDSYYQARRRSILVFGHGFLPPSAQNIFGEKFEEDILEHLSFDIFLASVNTEKSTDKGQAFVVFTGSVLGQQILDDFGCKEYTHIQFSGPVKEGKLDERMLKIRDKLENRHNQKIWDELGRRCIECGKCTIVCPTCFCFRIDDQAELGPISQAEPDSIPLDKDSQPSGGDKCGLRQRCWDSCFYQEFSEISGGHKFLDETAKRIRFWYLHKFVRIPAEFDFMGCVGCRRCATVCPVGIDIAEVLKKIEES